MAKLEVSDISELLVIESLLNEQTYKMNRKHFRYYTVRNLLSRVRKTVTEALNESTAEVEKGGQP